MATNIPRTLKSAQQLLRQGQIRVSDIIDQAYSNIQSKSHLNAFVNVQDKQKHAQQIEESQKRYSEGKQLSDIDGLPIAIKHTFIFQGFTPNIDATVIRKLKQNGAIIVGKTNMDEFGMGSLGMYGYNDKKITRNPIDEEYIAGGSSSGSAVATKSGYSLGTDTGGSVSYPAHCCGLYSMKPSYGRLSRFGQILYSSSNDVIGPMTNSSDDLESLFDIMQGEDSNDSNCINFSNISKIRHQDRLTKNPENISLQNLRVGIVQEFDIAELDNRNRTIQDNLKSILKDQGAQLINVQIPLIKYALPFYFTLVPAEASSNLSRYDGIKYGYQIPIGSQANTSAKQDLFDYIERVRSEAFGINVKRRVLLGNFLLSSRFEDYNEKVIESQRVRRLLIQQYCKVMEENQLDIIISPVSIGIEPPKINDILNDNKGAQKNPVFEYKMDYFTALPNCLGIPAITMPVQECKTYKFPSSFMIQGYFGEDYHLLKIAKELDSLLRINKLNVEI
ncbi:UNKNOWN [Stylonychia lemnae]|uniref:Amidase domain-containing protein n=1 Tax=Stylonychia lemnae TaxID=5949 RepID=A0A078B5S0_STYLE|nr:UNKNOWN [Stylonychia lemnae]|eukprot:CDW89865.1 UNKNOWN [Stylonychia lemnae]